MKVVWHLEFPLRALEIFNKTQNNTILTLLTKETAVRLLFVISWYVSLAFANSGCLYL